MARLLCFAALADRLGRTSEKVSLPAEVRNVRGLLAWLRSRGGAREQLLGDSHVRVTVGRQLVSLDNPIDDNSEIALLLRPLAP